MQVPVQAAGEVVHPITPAMLVAALAKEGASLSEADITVPAGVVARGAEPDFVVQSIEPVAGTTARYWVKLGCSDTSECLPFYASVVSSAQLSCGIRRSKAGRVVPVSTPVIHPGDRARLVIHHGSSVIELSVVALESGSIGQSIRIATPNYKEVFHGQVVSATQLEGAM